MFEGKLFALITCAVCGPKCWRARAPWPGSAALAQINQINRTGNVAANGPPEAWLRGRQTHATRAHSDAMHAGSANAGSANAGSANARRCGALPWNATLTKEERQHRFLSLFCVVFLFSVSNCVSLPVRPYIAVYRTVQSHTCEHTHTHTHR